MMERFVANSHRQRLATGLAAALRKLGIAGCRRVVIGGSFVTNKEYPNDFDGWYESFGLDLNVLDRLFLEDTRLQFEILGGTLFEPPNYEGFFQTDREGRPKGVIVLDPKEMIIQSGVGS
jgi:hypothetical protein